MEFLQRNNLLNQRGHAIEWAGLVNNLFYAEPSNFIFTYFLKLGLFHNLIKKRRENCWSEITIMEEILAIVCTLFAKIPVWKDSSAPRLPPLPEEFVSALETYHTTTISTYRDYIKNYSRTNINQILDNFLPWSNLAFPSLVIDPNLITLDPLGIERNQPDGVSLFAGLSGCIGKFCSLKEILSTMKHTILLDGSVLPLDSNPPTLLNSYALDFSKHGSQKRINIENDMKSPNETDKFLREMNKYYFHWFF